MKYKEFVIKSVAKKLNKYIAGGFSENSVNSILLDFAVKEFNEKANLEDNFTITDYNLEISKLTDMLENSSKQEKIEILMKLAYFIDHLTEQNRFFYFIPLDEIYLTSNKNILFNWFDFSNYCVQDQFIIPKEIRQKYGIFFDSKITSNVPYQLLDKNLSKNSFIKLMMQCIYPKIAIENLISIKYWINVAITELGFTPEERNFIVKLITDNKEFINCQTIITQYQETLAKSIVNIPNSLEKMKWNFGFHTEQGRNKKSIQNEDAYEIIRTDDEESILFMVADGVSTADVGRGKIVSARIQEYIADKEDSIKEFMMSISKLDHHNWALKVKKEIISLLNILNINITEELNIRMREKKNNSTIDHPMSSTIIIGMINNNRCQFAYLGDSHLFYLTHNNIILRLTEEDNVLKERVKEYINQVNTEAFITTNRDKHLSKTFPAIEFDENNGSFNALDLSKELTYFEFYPELNCDIIASTDGLLDSIGSSSNEMISEQELLKITKKYRMSSKDNHELAREIGRHADSNSGIDNITLLVLSNEPKLHKELKQHGKNKDI